MSVAPRLLLLLLALTAGDRLRADEPPNVFTPAAGFGGHTEGNGTLRVLFGRPRPFHADSFGVERADGSFQLDQTIAIRGLRPLNRTWVITPVGPDRYTATLTDAAGRVTAVTDGDRLSLRYRYRGPFVAHQTLVLRPDGRTIDNAGRMTLLGVPVGRLRETITRAE